MPGGCARAERRAGQQRRAKEVRPHQGAGTSNTPGAQYTGTPQAAPHTPGSNQGTHTAPGRTSNQAPGAQHAREASRGAQVRAQAGAEKRVQARTAQGRMGERGRVRGGEGS